MTDPNSSGDKSPMGGGAPLAGLILLGTIVGIATGQPSIGILAGLALGVIVAVAIWLKGRG
ncbi:hypothetical protein M2336_003383 [Sphingobium sp. B1D7B]|uniref:hypothetical protein n=1 Tax=unclassified Sphingobium TaxID=2611147 RepID=UPI002224A5A2|nr:MULTISPECIES: hypothetical protein [unclassified Sphingobium]MCW2349663.1 hypothetical protein [Sphingobium sp. B12D2B]MCW2368767.1 hypothetical protein [Sphingobium sp. B11D3D]MCW2391538.1 hypothetical protein [Sphingobium sp. B11D3A]MCW2406754.1 hypothetical protein [Sphingobium sp. B1D7B]MCW2411257.1 hypothetical protein [Sphingobium sp. B8D3D]